MHSIKFVNFPLYNKNYDCLFEALSMFSYAIEAEDKVRLINKITQLMKYQGNDERYQKIIRNIVNMSNDLNISESRNLQTLN